VVDEELQDVALRLLGEATHALLLELVLLALALRLHELGRVDVRVHVALGP
jgi:hypothetical protein